MTTLIAEPIAGSTLVVVLSAKSTATRGGAAEFRRFGLSIVPRDDVFEALAEVVRDPSAILVVSADYPSRDLQDVFDVAVATCATSVLLGMTPTVDTSVVAAAMRSGVRGMVDLPLTPERLSAALRTLPAPPVNTEPISVGPLTIDAARHRIDWGGRPIEVSPREFAVLYELAQQHPHMVTLDELSAGYGGKSGDPHAALRVAISHLRTRFKSIAGAGGESIIETVRGIGYRMTNGSHLA